MARGIDITALERSVVAFVGDIEVQHGADLRIRVRARIDAVPTINVIGRIWRMRFPKRLVRVDIGARGCGPMPCSLSSGRKRNRGSKSRTNDEFLHGYSLIVCDGSAQVTPAHQMR